MYNKNDDHTELERRNLKFDNLKINDRVLLNGRLCGDTHCKGNYILKHNSIMYVSSKVSDGSKYCIGLSNIPCGMRIGWSDIDDTIKLSSSSSREFREVRSKNSAKSENSNIEGEYYVSAKVGTKIRDGAGSDRKSLVNLPNGHYLYCDGSYTIVNGTKWLYCETTYRRCKYFGFCSKNRIKKLPDYT